MDKGFQRKKQRPKGLRDGGNNNRNIKASDLKKSLPSSGPLYVALYKPFGVLSQFTGEEGQRTLREIGLPQGIYAAGRLDQDSEGLLLLSNDGPFIDKLIHPRNGHSRSYLVQVEKTPDNQALQRLCKGVVIKGYQTKPCRAELLVKDPELPLRDPPIRERKNIPTAWLRVTLTEGKNRQVRRMTAAVGFPTLRLVRERIGKLELGDLKPGEWREVSAKDIL
ncbi:pseudouridine synthase [Kiloniella antarctica]|uniref:Pseudouridine synthase n=1 Tax=Kiloniella antarctica TaxID=1550907 RepID=A0ABW5BQ45_9PROT